MYSFALFQESLSTDPLLASPDHDHDTQDEVLTPDTPIPPPRLYTDHVLPLNPATLSAHGHDATPLVVPPPLATPAGAHTSLYAVTNSNNSTVESKTFNSSEISV